jgi:foldase protein PrsA
METDELTPVKESLRKKILRKKVVIPLVAVFLIGGAAYRFKDQFVVAMVNGQPISRLAIIKELEKQYGEGTLETLITKTLVLQEAKKQGVVVSDEEVSQEMARIEESVAAQGQNLDQVLGMQGISREELEEQIEIQKIAEKIADEGLEVTDEEVEKYFEENRESFADDVSEEELKENIREQLKQQKLNEAINSWVTSLRDTATINYFRRF